MTCEVRHANAADDVWQTRESTCYVCARALLRAPSEADATAVALGHHVEDVNQTLLMNLLYTASDATLVPRQTLFRGPLSIIRPSYHLNRRLIRTVLRHACLRPVRNPCPNTSNGTRARVRRFLARRERIEPRTTANLFKGIRNLKSDYLPGPCLTNPRQDAPDRTPSHG